MRDLRTNMFIFVFLFFLTSCGKIERFMTNLTGELTYKCSRSGVEYVQSDSGLAVSVDTDGRPIKCVKN
jgi:hypothetical protein